MRTAAEKLSSFFLRESLAGSGDRVVAAVSGGADSVCMLLLLDRIRRETGFSLRTVHVHHGIRGESADGDARFVTELCRSLGIRCEVLRVDVPAAAKKRGTGIEETARAERYRALRESCLAWEREENTPGEEKEPGGENAPGAENNLHSAKGRYRIAVAHHMEDQAETVLFRMARGSGLAGMAGMRPAAPLSDDPEILVIRPLLQFTRAEIEEIVTEAGTGWREDETNGDTAFARNRIRAGILPELAQINEAAVRHICALAEESAQTGEYLRAETAAALDRCAAGGSGTAGIVIDVKTLFQEHPLIADRILLEALARAAGRRRDISREHVAALRELCTKDGTAEGDFPGGVRALASSGRLMLAKADAPEVHGTVPGEASQPAAEEERQLFPEEDPQIPSQEEDPQTQMLLAIAREKTGVMLPLSASDYHMEVFPYCGTGEDAPSDTYTKWLDYDKIQEFPALRTRRKGDRIGLDAEGTEKKLSRCLIDAGIPEPLRDRIVLPCSGGDVLWIPGYRIHAAYKVSGETKRILCITLKESQTGTGESYGSKNH